MGVVIGLILVAFGAILTWAVDAHANGINVTAVGVILLVVGLIVIILDFLWWNTWRAGPWRRTYVATAPPAGYAAPPPAAPTRRVVVDEEVAGPPGPPPPP